MDQNNGLEAKASSEGTRTTLTMDPRDFPPQFIRTCNLDRTSQLETTIRLLEDHMINGQINQSMEEVETNLEMDFLTIKMETGEIMETFMVLHRLKRETSHKKKIHTVNQEVINLTLLLSSDLKIDIRPVLQLTDKKFHKTITRRHLMWFV